MKQVIEDLKKILIFIGGALQAFLINMISNFAYIFVVILITTAVFFLSFNAFHRYYPFVLYLVVLTAVNYMIRSRLFFKNRLLLDLMFLHFLDGRGDFLRVELPANAWEISGAVRANLKKKGLKFIPDSLVLAVTALRIIKEGESGEPEIKLTPVFKLLALQGFAFLVLFIPFGIISFFYTLGMAGGFKFFIYLLGFFFAYFLNAVIVDPITRLMITLSIRDH